MKVGSEGAAHILPRAAGEGDHPKDGGGGGRRLEIWLRVALTLVLLSAAAQVRAAVQERPELARGAYLVSIAACGGCHTPKTANGPGPLLSGGRTFGRGAAAVVAPNITPDRATGIGAWSDAEIAAAIHEGVRPDGSRIGPPMPQLAYHAMRDADVRAIVAYLRSVPPVADAVPQVRRTIAPPRLAPPAVICGDDPVAAGRYLANAVTHCTECHTPGPPTAPEFATHLDAGGRAFPTAKGPVVAPAITPESLRRYSDDDLAAIITKGRRPDGSALEGPMPVGSYAHLTPGDVRAIVAFLRKG